jgi:hypothetical protein
VEENLNGYIVKLLTCTELSSLEPHLDCCIEQVSVAVNRNDEHPPFDLPQKRHFLEFSDFMQWDCVAGFCQTQDFLPVHLSNTTKHAHSVIPVLFSYQNTVFIDFVINEMQGKLVLRRYNVKQEYDTKYCNCMEKSFWEADSYSVGE